MPRTSKADTPVSLDEPVIEGRYAELGEYTVGFETHKADVGKNLEAARAAGATGGA